MRIVLLSIFLFMSCRPSAVEDKNSQEPLELIAIDSKGDFKEFWKNLGQALMLNDTIVLDKYLDSTVFFYGREDIDPRFELNGSERIIKVREVYLTGGIYDYQKDTSISYVDFFLNVDLLNKDYLQDKDIQQIEDFVFRRNTSGEWKLTGVYSDTKKIK